MTIDQLYAKSKVAFITGITGQDGSYLSELLLEKGYQVHGLIRPTSQRRQALNRPLRPGITLHFGDLSDVGRLIQILSTTNPDEIYHLAAQSHVGVSFETPISTSDSNALGTLRLLEAMRILKMEKKTRFYNASSAELYGSEMAAPQTEETPFHPVSPYAISKQFQFWTTVNFREAYDFHASNGILFNHESPRRGITFVTRKITSQVAMIACGQIESFELGNLNALRDWGHAKDYMHGVYLMLQQPKSGDYVLASGQAYSVREFVEAAFRVIDVDIKWSGHGVDEVGYDSVTSTVRVRVNPKFYRPLENENLLGSPEKARKILGWEPKYDFQGLVKEMIMADIEAVQNGKIFANTHLDWLMEEKTGPGAEESVIPKTNGHGLNGNDHSNHVIHNDVLDNGEEYTTERLLVGGQNGKAAINISCRWKFSNSDVDPFALRHFHCLDLLMTINSLPTNEASRNTNQEEESGHPAGTAIHGLMRACQRSQQSTGSSDTAFKVILVPRNGYLCRKDILRLRMQDSEMIDSLINLANNDDFFPAMSHDHGSILSLLPSSPAALLLKPFLGFDHAAFKSLDRDLKLRLSFDWILPKKPVPRRIALVGGRYQYDMKQDSFGHKGTFDAAQGLDISVVVLDKPGHWLQDDQYCHLREDFIAIDMTDDIDLPSRIVGALKGRSIDGITTFSDEVVIPTARAAEMMQLPTESVQSILQAHNKFEARKLLSPDMQVLQLDSSDHLERSSMTEKLQTCQYPLVLKPSMGGGSRGVKKANDYQGAQRAIRQVQEDGFASRGILLEPYIEGPEVDANFVLWDGEVLFFEVLDGLPCQADASDATISDTFNENVEVLPSGLDSHELQTIRSTLHRGLLQLGLRSGVFHVEARIRNSSKRYEQHSDIVDLVNTNSTTNLPMEVVLIEVNARIPGLMPVFATMFTYGVDYGALMLLRAVGDRERFTVLSKPFACHSQYWTGLICIPIHRKDIVVPENFCDKVIERVPEIAPQVSRAECLATAKVVSPVGGTGFVGYFLVFSRTSRGHVLKMSARIQEAARGLLDGS